MVFYILNKIAKIWGIVVGNLLNRRKAKGAFRAPFYIGGSCRMIRFARPSGRRRKQLRCLTAFDSNLQQVLILPESYIAKRRL